MDDRVDNSETSVSPPNNQQPFLSTELFNQEDENGPPSVCIEMETLNGLKGSPILIVSIRNVA